jgi:hypothetical protein
MGAQTVLDPSGLLRGATDIQAHTVPRAGVRYEVAIGAVSADAVVLVGGDLLGQVESAAGAGYAPDPAYSRAGVAVMRRGPAPWPVEALRYFVESLGWREERRLNGALLEIQAQLSRDADELRAAVQGGGVDEARLRAMEERFEELIRAGQEDSDVRAHLARLDRKVLEINRGMQALSGRIDGIFASRTWKALTAAGGVLLRVTGRKG